MKTRHEVKTTHFSRLDFFKVLPPLLHELVRTQQHVNFLTSFLISNFSSEWFHLIRDFFKLNRRLKLGLTSAADPTKWAINWEPWEKVKLVDAQKWDLLTIASFDKKFRKETLKTRIKEKIKVKKILRRYGNRSDYLLADVFRPCFNFPTFFLAKTSEKKKLAEKKII